MKRNRAYQSLPRKDCFGRLTSQTCGLVTRDQHRSQSSGVGHGEKNTSPWLCEQVSRESARSTEDYPTCHRRSVPLMIACGNRFAWMGLKSYTDRERKTSVQIKCNTKNEGCGSQAHRCTLMQRMCLCVRKACFSCRRLQMRVPGSSSSSMSPPLSDADKAARFFFFNIK